MKKVTLIEALGLAAECCACLFTFDQLFVALGELDPQYTEDRKESARTTVMHLVKAGKWKKVGTTGGWMTSVYCASDVPLPEIMTKGQTETKVIKKLSSDLPIKDVLGMLHGYIMEHGGDQQQLANRVQSLQDALVVKNQETIDLKAAHKKEVVLVTEQGRKRYKELDVKYQTLVNQVKALKL